MRDSASVKATVWIRPRRLQNTPLAVLVLSAAACLLLLVSPGDVRGSVGTPPEDESSAACSHVNYGTPSPVAAHDAAGNTVTKPPNPNGPTIVGVGFFVNDIRGIDPVGDEFQFRGYVQALWCDPRLAFDPAETGQQVIVITGDRVDQNLKRMWFPSGYPVNKVGERHIDNLFGRNRRVAICIDNPELGRVTVVMVAAMIVGRITVSGIDERDVPEGLHTLSPAKSIERGDEIGIFHLGSTAVVFCEPAAAGRWDRPMGPLLLGEPLSETGPSTPETNSSGGDA